MTEQILNDLRDRAKGKPIVIQQNSTAIPIRFSFIRMLGTGEMWSLEQVGGDWARIHMVRFSTGSWFPWSIDSAKLDHADFVVLTEDLTPLRIELAQLEWCRGIVETLLEG